MSMREVVAVAAAVSFTACATPRYRTPCRVVVEVILEEGAGIQTECWQGGLVFGDDGKMLPPYTRVRGCKKMGNVIVVPDQSDVLHHEMRHVWDERCRP
jgi:hypothetical protein